MGVLGDIYYWKATMLLFSCFFLAGGISGKILTRIEKNSIHHQASPEDFFAALNETGQIQFTGLGSEYKAALQNIRKKLPNCLDESLEVELDDGSRRFTIARDTDTDIRPFHTDNGLYLLLTPSPVLQLLTMSREGSVYEIPSSDDSIILLLGTGLTSWLLPHHHLYSPPHAVPSIANHLTRAVFGRMKVAPLEATNYNSDITFGQHFYSGLSDHGDELHQDEHGDKLHHARLRRQAEAGHAHHWVGNKTVTE